MSRSVFTLAQSFCNRVRAHLLPYATLSYSQEGEDMILRRVFAGEHHGFYVDVGAHHPKRFSNTYYFYTLGWSGINIDATPGSMEAFRRQRPRDTNIEAAIARTEREIPFFIFNEPALNSFDPELSRARDTGPYKIVARKMLRTRSLADLLSEHLPDGKKIHFMSVDAEGMDLEVLQSNDWARFAPSYVVIECGDFDMSRPEASEAFQFMSEHGYRLFAKTVLSAVYQAVSPRGEPSR